MITELIRGNSSSCNCYVVGSEKTNQGMVIDPGARPKLILQAVARLGLSISLIVVTHAHWDHVGALVRLKEVTGADFLLHEAEKIRGIWRVLSRFSGLILGESFRPLPDPDRLLHDGDIIELGDLNFTVLHTPGHTPGGICLFGEGVVFSGDTLFNHTIGRFNARASRLRFVVPGFSYAQLMNSIASKLMALPDETRVLPGHGSETTIGSEREHNPSLRKWREQRNSSKEVM